MPPPRTCSAAGAATSSSIIGVGTGGPGLDSERHTVSFMAGVGTLAGMPEDGDPAAVVIDLIQTGGSYVVG